MVNPQQTPYLKPAGTLRSLDDPFLETEVPVKYVYIEIAEAVLHMAVAVASSENRYQSCKSRGIRHPSYSNFIDSIELWLVF